METTPALEQVIEAMRPAVGRYARLIQSLAGENLLELSLFGTMAAGTFDASRHYVRSVLVLRHVNLEWLRQLAESGMTLERDRIAAPLVMTPHYIADSRDTFPLELIELRQQHLTLLGKSHFAELEFEPQHLRHACERELKVLLLSMRQALLAAAGSDAFLRDMTPELLDELLRTLRGLLWLDGRHEPQRALAVTSAVELRVEASLPGLRSVLETGFCSDWTAFERLYRDVETVAQYVNGM